VSALQSAADRLDRTIAVLDLYGKELKRWEAADSATRARLRERTDSVGAQAKRLLGRLRLPRDGKGIGDDTTALARVQEALGRATSTPDVPTPDRIAVLDRTAAAARALLAEIDAFYRSSVAEYREALRAAGFEPLGGA
jgi:hypothetical protein